MSKRQFKSQASSSRAPPTGGFGSGFGTTAAPFGSSFGSASTALSYLGEQPDLTSIMDPNVVVNFKNLSKRDGITKAKALEDLQTYVLSLHESQRELEEPFIEAWVKVFPRASIDLSRRVRQDAQVLNGHICLSGGKRIARYMPDVIGAWIAGLHDGDKPVMRAAHEALQRVFPTQEKQASLTKVYQSSILKFAMDAIKETPATLSDDRVTTQEDADAKFSRVFSSNTAVIDNLLNTLSDKDVAKLDSLYQECINVDHRWKTAASPDSGVRRSTLRLLQTVLIKKKDWIADRLSSLCTDLFSRQAVSNQMGSSLEYTNTLIVLTRAFPSIWQPGTERTTPVMRLAELAKAGSQGAPSQFWQNIKDIFRSITTEYLPASHDQVSKLLKQVHSGITRKDEPRTHMESAWDGYIRTVELLATRLETAEHQTLLKEFLFPIIQQYLKPLAENSQWSVSGPRAAVIVAKALRSPSMDSLMEVEWPSITQATLEHIQISSPEQSKDYQNSQTALISEGSRFFILQNEMLKSNPSETFSKIIRDSTNSVISGSQGVLIARDGKPYGAAGLIEAGLRTLSPWFFEEPSLVEPFMPFVSRDIPRLIASPSQKFLVSILYECQHQTQFAEAWNSVVTTALKLPDLALRLTTIRAILSSPRIPANFAQPINNTALQTLIVEQSQSAVESDGDFAFINDILAAPTRVISIETGEEIMQSIMKTLGDETKASSALSGLRVVLQRDSDLLNDFLEGPHGSVLLQNLLFLTEANSDELATSAAELNKTLERLTSVDQNSGKAGMSTLKILENGLYEASVSSLSIETLVELAQRTSKLLEVFPDPQRWSEVLDPILRSPLPPSLALTNLLGGVIYLVDESKASYIPRVSQFDRDGYSAALRIALYVVKLLRNNDTLAALDRQKSADIYTRLLLTVQLASDKLGLYASNQLWTSFDATTETEMLDFVSEAQALLASWRNSATEVISDDSFIGAAHEALFRASASLEPTAFQNGRVFALSVSELIETLGWQQNTTLNLEEQLKSLRRGKEALSFTCFVVAYKTRLSSTPAYTRICNELVAALTGDNLSKNSADVLQKLVYFNIMASDQDGIVETIAKQRLIFFVKHVVPWLSDDAADHPIRAEVCKALNLLLPYMKDIYGPHWADVLTTLAKSWNQEDPLSGTDITSATIPWLQSSMKLTATLRALTLDEESNDDLKDAWNEAKLDLSSGLMHLLGRLGQFPDELNQPLQVLNELLGRQIHNMPANQIERLEDMYPLMGSASHRVQKIAFDLLHRQIPATQEQISIESALDKKPARLPDELLSLIIEAPTMDSMAGFTFDRTMPLSLQTYLSSWLLLFDHFKNASDKVKNDYIEHLKEGDYLNGFLSLTFDFLGHGSGKPIDATRFEVTSFTFGLEESPLKEVQWLLIHLYYLCLKRLPALTKTWWMECKSRQIVVNVETWTEKYISPSIIIDALNTVNEWAEAQDAASDEAIIVKVNQRTKEVVISKEIDDQMMSMAIKLPANFPFGQAVLHGVNRVAVDEKKWRSWLLNSQGVITFSNNSLIDGIIAFRRNVVGALKGQTECAICYSIVGEDKQLPTKRCLDSASAFPMNSSARNQPQYDFLTGAPLDPVLPIRDTLRGSVLVRPDTNNEDYRAQLHKLQYEIESLKQERDATTLRHGEELRAAQNKADSDFALLQASESGRLAAVSKHETIAREIVESQDRHAKEKRDLERKVRNLQDDNAAVNEEVEEIRTELASQERQFKHALSEVESMQKVAQQATEDMRGDLDEKVAALQKSQQMLSERQSEAESLRNEIMRLKTQAGDAETLEIIKETLREQVAHITKLEATTQKQQTELRQFRKQQKAIEIVEEEKRTLETKVRMMYDLRTQLSEAQLQRQILEDERKSWSTYLEMLSAGDEEVQFDSPERLAKAYVQEREEKASLVDKLGRIQPDLSAKDGIISSLEEQISTLKEEMEQLRISLNTKTTDPKAQARLERQRTLAIKEVEYLRAQLKLYEAEEGDSHPERADKQRNKRVQELEELTDQYRKELDTLHQTLTAATKNNHDASQQQQPQALSPQKSLKRPYDDETDARLGELSRRNRTLQDDLSKSSTARSVLEKELAAHKSQLVALKASSRTRVLELRSNPTAHAEAVKRSTLEVLRAENSALLAQLGQIQDPSPPTPSNTGFAKPKLVPQATVDRLRADMAAQEAVIREKDTLASRRLAVYSNKIKEFIDAVGSVLGWDFRIMPNGRVKCTSVFYPGAKDASGGEEEQPHIIVDVENGTMKVSGGLRSEFANEIRDLIEFWVDGKKEIRCFMAACTLEFREKYGGD